MLMLPLPVFVDAVRGYEESPGSEEGWFWNTHEKIGNYLADPINQEITGALNDFLKAWRSVRHPIDWND